MHARVSHFYKFHSLSFVHLCHLTTETHWTLVTCDYCTDRPVHISVTKNEIKGFDETVIESMVGHATE